MPHEPFNPIGEKARWKLIFVLLQAVATNAILTYDEMTRVLDKGVTRDKIQNAARRAGQELLLTESRAIEAVLARGHQRKSSRALGRSADLVTHVDLNKVEDPEVRKALVAAAHVIEAQRQFNKNMDIRQRNLEQLVADHQEETGRTAEEVAKLRERLSALERGTS
jgi:hypothetical protein